MIKLSGAFTEQDEEQRENIAVDNKDYMDIATDRKKTRFLNGKKCNEAAYPALTRYH
jgi:hypothetical protein